MSDNIRQNNLDCVVYVYILQSEAKPKEIYIGYSTDLKRRIKEHNAGHSIHTNKFKPWKIMAYFAFEQQITAENFEKYLKSCSGRAFINKHNFIS